MEAPGCVKRKAATNELQTSVWAPTTLWHAGSGWPHFNKAYRKTKGWTCVQGLRTAV